MSEEQIPYDVLTQDALRGVVSSVLKRVEKSGLPGDHHFYIAFDTRADGVSVSDRLKEQYPEEMTVVLQYQFWDLIVGDDKFEVKLSFNNLPEHLIVPYGSIKAFFDPSVRFGLQFGAPPGAANDEAGETATVPAIVKSEDGTGQAVMPDPTIEHAIKQAMDEAESVEDEPAVSEETGERPIADVVELDAFRKK
jgi:hypothetical protein